MVEWLAPRVLLHSAQEVVLSGLFANFADKRETMSGLSDEAFRYDQAASDSDFWFDYTSDVGDGFDATYAIAKLLAQPLALGSEDTEPVKTERGRLLVLGGDQVYPTASWEAYEERFRLPYSLALPNAERQPHLFAIPGNHDWYDGLTAFTRVFGQGGHVGGWQTRQARSYFALKLPRGWWLWGIDIQFDAYIDGPQIDYFKAIARQAAPGDQVILATAKPSWVHVEDPENAPQSWKSLAWFEEEVICKASENRAKLALTLTGDLHHYSRYEPVDRPEDGLGAKVTAGGGGAYLSPTHWLPVTLTLPDVKRTLTPVDSPAPTPTEHERVKIWPPAEASRDLARGILGHRDPRKTKRLWMVLGPIYALLALLTAAAVRDQAPNFGGGAVDGGARILTDAVSIWLLLLAGALVLGLRTWARSAGAPGRYGVLHAVAHLVLAWGATVAVLLIPLDAGFLRGYVATAVLFVVGVLLGRLIFVQYLWGTHRAGVKRGAPLWHANEVFAGQGIADYKHFLRFRIDAAGRLTMWAVGLEQVAHYASELGPDGQPVEQSAGTAPTVFDYREVQAPVRAPTTSPVR
jgi:hypothetical protein